MEAAQSTNVQANEEATVARAANECPVNSPNEWDPLEEVIVGRLEGATMPSHHVATTYTMPPTLAKLYRFIGGMRYPRWLVKAAQKELDEFIRILEGEGVTVSRPDVIDCHKLYKTPHWKSRGFCIASPGMDSW